MVSISYFLWVLLLLVCNLIGSSCHFLEAKMTKEQNDISFSQLFKLNQAIISDIPSIPSIYMICKRDSACKIQVIFAGTGLNLQTDLTKYLNENSSNFELLFCYTPTSKNNALKNANSPLYQRAA